MQRHILLITLCVLFTGVLKIPDDSAIAEERLTFIDASEKTVTVTVPARRIVVLTSDAAEILSAIGASDRIVGISGYIAENSTGLLYSLKDKQAVGYPNEPNMEKIVELAPDLVITYDMWLTEATFEDKLVPLGIAAARIDCYQIDRLEADIRLLGKLTGREEQAETYIETFQKPLCIVHDRLKGIKRPVRVYTEGYADYAALSKRSGAAMMLKHVGVENITDDLPFSSPIVTSEWVVTQNPAIILKAVGYTFAKSGYGVTNTTVLEAFRDRLLKRPAWKEIDAVKTGNVYLLSAEIWAGPRAPIGILYIAKWCYPDLFTDIDPRALHGEWLRTWYHKELKGIYVYPE